MTVNLTEGKPEKVLFRFTLPLFISVVFQQLYNMADSWIAGNYAQDGESALAAVGASYPITMIFMAIAVGSNIGCSVVISHYFGAKRFDKVKTVVYTSLIGSLAISALLSLAGRFFSAPLLRLVKTPEVIFSDSALYFNIYIYGFAFVFLYNVATGIFTALGDSKTPLYFLIGSSLGNIALDALFVIVFHWDVAGVAWATFIAQGVACVLALITLFVRLSSLRCDSYSRFSFRDLGLVGRFALPSILQQSFISLGGIAIQSLINRYDSAAILAGYSAAIKLNTFALTSFNTLGNGMSSFTAQNIGAGKPERVSKGGFRGGLVMGLSFSALFFLIYFFFGGQLVSAFIHNPSELAVETGRMFLWIVSPFYMVVTVKIIIDGVLRGSGRMGQFMFATFIDLVLRVALSYLFDPLWQTTGIWISWPVGWLIAMGISLIFYKKGGWQKSELERTERKKAPSMAGRKTE